MELINPLVQSYAEKYTSGEDALLQEIAAFTFNNHPKAHMLSGHIQGKFLELREEDANTAKAYFDRSFFKDQIILHIGDALELIGEIDELWDLVFIDADKENYINYFNLVLPKLKPKGFILADNVLFHGQVLEEPVKGKNAKAIQAFNDFVAGRDDVERLLLPVRDGLCLIRKLH